jgi:serine/threonine protein kinase
VTPGAQLGPYKIEQPIGEGGMGAVFRATDTRLGRAVALKTCHEEFSERFQREARVIASLNHRHICCLYDSLGSLATISNELIWELPGERQRKMPRLAVSVSTVEVKGDCERVRVP